LARGANFIFSCVILIIKNTKKKDRLYFLGREEFFFWGFLEYGPEGGCGRMAAWRAQKQTKLLFPAPPPARTPPKKKKN